MHVDLQAGITVELMQGLNCSALLFGKSYHGGTKCILAPFWQDFSSPTFDFERHFRIYGAAIRSMVFGTMVISLRKQFAEDFPIFHGNFPMDFP